MNLDIYPNLALTYLFYEKKDEAYKCLVKAIEMDRENVKYNNAIRRYPKVEKLLQIFEKTDFEGKLPEWGWKSKLQDYLRSYASSC